MDEVKVTFTYDDVKFSFKYPRGENPPEYVMMPTGVLLKIGGYLESFPPQPVDIEVVKAVSAWWER